MGLDTEKEVSHYFIRGSMGSHILTIILCLLPVAAFAAWSSPVEIISESWGSGNTQFGIKYEDTLDMLPRFTITSEGKIVVRDGINKRLKVYSGVGGFETIFPYRAGRKYTELTLADSYGFSGDFVGYGEGGANYFYRADQKIYINFSPTGQLITTSSTRPLELGKVSEKAIAENQYKITITYPDKTYDLTSDVTFMSYIRDSKNTINAINSGAVWKFNQCGKEIGELTIPKIGKEMVPTGNPKLPHLALKVEYGEPVVSPSGDVYTWKKTDLKYSILKWTWVDDPSVPSGPDAPTGLTAMPSTSGIYLTWKASPQDPGCVTGYEVARSTTSGGTFTTLPPIEKGVVKYNDTTAEAGQQYYYKVRAKAGSEYSQYTSEIPARR